jgi:myo-inositol 2-dehydrogenase / D-chiro-inositol 1-dehydrogenase
MSEKKQIGLAVIGCGVVGRMRATLARDFPGIGWIGLKPECRPRHLNRVDE